MNTDPKKSTRSCGCDEGANHPCDRHKEWPIELWQMSSWEPTEPVNEKPVDRKLWRKQRPLYSGCIAYFPNALMEVAYVSFIGNEQHNPGEKLHWSRDKSSDHLDAEARHLADHSKDPYDDDGVLHLAKNAWRALAELQLYLEKKQCAPVVK